MKAIEFQKITRILPLPGRIIRRLIKVVDRHIEYPIAPIISNARWDVGQFELIDCREYIQQSIFFLGYYEIRESRLIRRLLRPGDTFVDIGANLGWFTVLGSKRVGQHGKVIAFEPSTNIWLQLNRSVEINRLCNVHLERLALSDETGTTFLTGATAENSGLASIISATKGSSHGQGEDVAVTKFDDYWKREINARVRLVKIDVEGAELKVLEGMKNFLQARQCDYLMIEISDKWLHSLGMSALHAINLLRSYNYDLYRIGMYKLKPILNDETVIFANVLAELRR